jgi:hypothetical protein
MQGQRLERNDLDHRARHATDSRERRSALAPRPLRGPTNFAWSSACQGSGPGRWRDEVASLARSGFTGASAGIESCARASAAEAGCGGPRRRVRSPPPSEMAPDSAALLAAAITLNAAVRAPRGLPPGMEGPGSASLPPFTDAGARRAPIARRRTLAARPERQPAGSVPGRPHPVGEWERCPEGDPLTGSADVPCRRGRRARRSPLPGRARASRPPGPRRGTRRPRSHRPAPAWQTPALEHARVGDRARRRPRRWRAARRTASSPSSGRRAAPSAPPPCAAAPRWARRRRRAHWLIRAATRIVST